jgi:hypothetical protein
VVMGVVSRLQRRQTVGGEREPTLGFSVPEALLGTSYSIWRRQVFACEVLKFLLGRLWVRRSRAMARRLPVVGVFGSGKHHHNPLVS